jgi:C1A family cysteine protease
MEFTKNTRKSIEDTRDFVGESIFPDNQAVPTTLDLRKSLRPIRNQGSQGSCAAQTSACIKEYHEHIDIDLNRYMSPQFIYNNRTNAGSEGMYGRDVMRILKNVGSCFETDYPYGTIEEKEKIDPNVYEIAKNFRISGYARVMTIDGLKKALYKNGPCYISVPTYNSGTRMWKPVAGVTQEGGHAMTVVGYDVKGFIIRNSWGTDWGDDGYCSFPYEDFGCQWELWTMIDAESSVVTDLDEPPSERGKCFATCLALLKK